MLTRNRFHKLAVAFCLFSLCILVLSACYRPEPVPDPSQTQAPEMDPAIMVSDLPVPSPSETSKPEPEPDLRYIFLFIGDGMGPNQVICCNEARIALGLDPFCFLSFPVLGSIHTDNVHGKTTDSAASATAMSAGVKTENGMLGMTPDGRYHYSLAKDLQESGWKIGILTTVSIDNATPAGFYAHVNSRKEYELIRDDLFTSRYDFFAGGGFHGDSDIEALAYTYGYLYTVGEDAAHQAGPGKLISVGDTLTTDRGLRLAADHSQSRDGLLARNVQLGIDRFQEHPFFMMVEGGRIDLACHYHDAGDLYWEMQDFDDAVRVALAFQQQHPNETLIIITSDHETGGLSLDSGDRTALSRQTLSCDSFDKVNASIFRSLNTPFESALQEVCSAFGLSDLSEEETAYLQEAYAHTLSGDLTSKQKQKLYGVYSPITSAAANLVAARAGLSFSSFDHTGVDIAVYASGIGAEYFEGSYENTEIHDRILEAVHVLGRLP